MVVSPLLQKSVSIGVHPWLKSFGCGSAALRFMSRPTNTHLLSRALLLCLSLAAAGDNPARQLDLTLRGLAETQPGSHHWPVGAKPPSREPRPKAGLKFDTLC